MKFLHYLLVFMSILLLGLLTYLMVMDKKTRLAPTIINECNLSKGDMSTFYTGRIIDTDSYNTGIIHFHMESIANDNDDESHNDTFVGIVFHNNNSFAVNDLVKFNVAKYGNTLVAHNVSLANNEIKPWSIIDQSADYFLLDLHKAPSHYGTAHSKMHIWKDYTASGIDFQGNATYDFRAYPEGMPNAILTFNTITDVSSGPPGNNDSIYIEYFGRRANGQEVYIVNGNHVHSPAGGN